MTRPDPAWGTGRKGRRIADLGNTVADLLSLCPALFAAGQGPVTFSDFRYRALD